jgi:hypothetical protein
MLSAIKTYLHSHEEAKNIPAKNPKKKKNN